MSTNMSNRYSQRAATSSRDTRLIQTTRRVLVKASHPGERSPPPDHQSSIRRCVNEPRREGVQLVGPLLLHRADQPTQHQHELHDQGVERWISIDDKC